jgi:nucleotide-binding universal stress UspA family protein
MPTRHSAWATTLAHATGAEVILFHIARPPAVALEGGPLLAGLANGEAANLWDRFHGTLPADPAIRVGHEVIVADKPGAGHILGILERLGCDLIVMRTHGHSWLKQRLFGSVTEEVVRRAHCPVLVVKAPVPAAPAPVPARATAT